MDLNIPMFVLDREKLYRRLLSKSNFIQLRMDSNGFE